MSNFFSNLSDHQTIQAIYFNEMEQLFLKSPIHEVTSVRCFSKKVTKRIALKLMNMRHIMVLNRHWATK